MKNIKILLVEDEDDQRTLVAGILSNAGFVTHSACSVEKAFEVMDEEVYDLVLSDWRLPGENGLALLKRVQTLACPPAFIMVTAYGSISNAVAAVRAGADDYLTKPYQRDALLLAIEKALKSRNLAVENQRLTEELGARNRLVDLIGSSESMQRLFRRVQKVAGTDVTVLLNGESGTGKELTARALHALSKRAPAPFIAVNCAAIPEGLLESEFFGAERGAFTGADRSRIGRFEAAQGGTLFLDEVGELPLAIQPKLLRALQEGVITRVGGTRDIELEVRIIAATNRDLKAEVAAGRFREDLYYRLHVVPVTLPPLRERREDIPRLVRHFVIVNCRRHELQFEGFSSAILKQFVEYSWPGNVRELANVVERLMLLAEDGKVHTSDLPSEFGSSPNQNHHFKLPPGGLNWERHEADCLRQALALAAGNRARAARLLDLNYKAFLYRLEKHGLANLEPVPGQQAISPNGEM